MSDPSPEDMERLKAEFEADNERIAAFQRQCDIMARRFARKAGLILQQIMLDDDLSIDELSKRIGISTHRVRRTLLGEDWRQYRSMVALSLALGCEFEISIHPIYPQADKKSA